MKRIAWAHCWTKNHGSAETPAPLVTQTPERKIAMNRALRLVYSSALLLVTVPMWGQIGVFPPGATLTNPSLNGSVYWDGTQLQSTATGGAGTQCLISTAGGTPVWGSCAGSASTVWSALTNPSGNLALAIGANLNSFTSSGNTSTNVLWSFLDTTGNTGTGYLFDIHSSGTSTINPLRVCAKGTSNCVSLNASGLWSASGTAGISATHINGTLLSGLATGIVKNTTGTGAFTIAVAGDFPTLNQNTTGTAANVTGVVAEANGGSGANNTPGSAGHVLRSNGTHYVDSAIQAGDLPTLNQNTSGSAGSLSGSITLANTPLTTQGDILFTNATPALARLGIGANGTFLASDGTTVSWGPAPASSLSALTAASTSNTISNGNNAQIWHTFQTSNNQAFLKIDESSAATGGTSTNQRQVDIETSAGSTAIPLYLANSLTGSQALPALAILPTWNTSGNPAGIFENVTNTASGANSRLMDLQVGAVSQFSVDAAGNTFQAGTPSYGVGGSNAGAVQLTQGTSNSNGTNAITLQAPTSVTSYTETLPGALAAGFWLNSSGGAVSFTPLSGDSSADASGAVTNSKVNHVSYPTTGSSFDALPILTASNTVNYYQINGGAACGDSSHALSYNQTTHLFGCQSITGSAAAGGSSGQLQGNASGALTGITSWTSNNTTTISAASGGILDLSGATGTAAFKFPTNTTNTATAAGGCDYDSTNSNFHCNSGADSLMGLVPTASMPSNGNVIDASVSSSKFLLHDSGVATANLTTAASNYTNGNLVQAAGNNKTTSDSGIATGNVVTAASNYTNGDLVQAAGANKTTSDSGILAANVVTDSGTATSNAVMTGAGTKTVQASTIQYSSNVLSSTTATQALTYQGGGDQSANAAGGAVTFRGADETGAGGASSQGGNALHRGGNNAGTNTASAAGGAEVVPGASTGATPGLQGLFVIAQPYAQSGTVTQWNLECFTSTAMTVSDCGASPTNIAGIALSLSSTVEVTVANSPSEIPVNASAAVTIGHTVCAGTTAGKVTDSGGTTACATGITVGTVVATSGAWPAFPDGTSFPTLSTTLPLIRLSNRHGIGNGDATAITTLPNLTSANGTTIPSSATLLTSGGALGTPSSGVATNITGLPISTGVAGLGSNVATFLGAPSGANLAAALTTALPNTKGGTGGDSSGSTGIAHVASGTWSYSTIATSDLASNAVTSAQMAVVNTYRVCDISIGDTSGSAITNAQLGPQSRVCFIPAASTIVEMDVNADGGTPNVIVGRNRSGTIVNIVSAALATAGSGGIACSNTGGTTGINGATTCSSTLQNTGLNAGDYLELVSGTAGGTAKFMVAHIIYTVN